MQIDSSGSVASLIQGTQEAGKPQQVQTANANTQQAITKTEQGDTVTLTDSAAHMQRLEQAIATQPVVNSHRVEQVQQVINDGSLKIDPSQLADRMLSFESALNNARSGA